VRSRLRQSVTGPAGLKEESVFVFNSSGTEIGIHHIVPAQKPRATVLLCHGLFSNYRTCRRLAEFLAGDGLECWLLDFQGHGISQQPYVQPDFESMVLGDVSAAMDFILERCDSVACIGHSGGGLGILMYLARYPERQTSVSAVVTLASQATDAAATLGNRFGMHVARCLTVGKVPGRQLGLGPEPEFAPVMQQWYRWNLSGRWEGHDGFEYLNGLKVINRPCLTLAAANDNYIAPAQGCQRLHAHLGTEDKTFHVCSKRNGDTADFTHAQLIVSKEARSCVWPRIANWLNPRLGTEKTAGV